MKIVSLGKYVIKEGFYKIPSITGGVPKHKDAKHCIRTLKILTPYIGEKIELFIKVKGE